MPGLITDGLSFWAKTTPEQPAIVYDDGDLVDYATLDAWTGEAAGMLVARGLTAGDRVGIVGGNSLAWIVAAIGVSKVAAVAVPYNNRFTTSELGHVIEDSDPSMILSDAPCRDRVVDAVGTREITCLDLQEFDALRHRSDHDQLPARRRDPDELMMIVYTSGSTAAPKGVMYTHRSMLNFIAELAVCEPAMRWGARMIYMLSVSGAPGLPWHIMQALTRGMTVFYERGFDAAMALTRLREERIEIMIGVPLQFDQIAIRPEFDDTDSPA